MSETSIYYRHSGAFAPLSLVATMAVSIIVAVVAGVLYGIVVYYMPIIYINVILCIGMGVGLGYLVRWLAMKQHIRNVPVIMLTGLVAGLAAEYAAFVGWLMPVTDWTEVIIEPRDLSVTLHLAADQGVWGFSKGAPVSGVMLYLFWLAEGLVIVGAATKFAVADLRTTPYCENCGRWLTEQTLIGPFEPIADVQAMRGSLERGDFAVIGDVKSLTAPSADGRFAEFELRDCPTCDEMAVMTVRNVTITVDKEGKATRSDTPIVQCLLIDKPSCELIKQLTPQPEAATTEAAAPVETPAEGAEVTSEEKNE